MPTHDLPSVPLELRRLPLHAGGHALCSELATADSFDQAVVHWGLFDVGGFLSDRLDESKIEQLRAWGTGLAANGSDDLRATGRAILMLIEEIERLHIDLWNATAREQTQADQGDGDDDQVQARLEPRLRARLRRARDR